MDFTDIGPAMTQSANESAAKTLAKRLDVVENRIRILESELIEPRLKNIELRIKSVILVRDMLARSGVPDTDMVSILNLADAVYNYLVK